MRTTGHGTATDAIQHCHTPASSSLSSRFLAFLRVTMSEPVEAISEATAHKIATAKQKKEAGDQAFKQGKAKDGEVQRRCIPSNP